MALRNAGATLIAGVGAVTTYRYRSVVARESDLPSHVLSVFTNNETTTTTANTAITSQQQQPHKKERVLIIGAGVVGVSTAYKLAAKGHSVAILEPMPEPGEECSACAAGGMQRSNPVVDKGSWISVLSCIAPKTARLVFGSGGRKNKDEDDHYQFFRMSWGPTLSDPFFLRWVFTFTKTSLFPGQDQHDKQIEMLNFTKYAVDDMIDMMEDPKDDMAIKAGYNSRGCLAVSYDDPVAAAETTAAAAAAPKETADTTKKSANPTASSMDYEPSRRIVGTDQVLREEPSLRFQARQPTAAKYDYDAKSASSGRFAKELARRCVQDPSLDVTFLYNTKVHGIRTAGTDAPSSSSKPRISELHTNQGVIQVPNDVKIVVCAGTWTPHVLALMDLYAPVYPLKGYAMSVSAAEALRVNPSLKPQDLPSRIVCDKYMYTTRLGEDEIRITSIGEFSEWDTQPTPHVDQNFRHEAIRQFPQLKEVIQTATTICGHRPFVSDGILLLGKADTHENLFVSCGPGSNGWKLALGSGEIIERLISGQTTEQIKHELGFDASVFSPAGRVLSAPVFAKLCRARWNV